MKKDTFMITNDDGVEKEMVKLFSFVTPEGVEYILFQDPDDQSGMVEAMRFDDDVNLSPIETDEEWQMCEEMLDMYQNGELEEIDENEKEENK